MKLSSLKDARLRSLVGFVRAQEAKLVSNLTSMLYADLADRVVLHQANQVLLGSIRAETRKWTERNLKTYYDQGANAQIKALRGAGVSVPDLRGAAESVLDNLGVALLERVDQAVLSIVSLSNRLRSANDPLQAVDLPSRQVFARAVRAGASSETARMRALGEFRKRLAFPATVAGQALRPRNYELAYYVAMVADSGAMVAKNFGPRLHGMALGLDLVRVSDNPSMHGDYCDAYAGKVFSLSGDDPLFPALALAPNAGPPFHPHCAHTLRLILPDEQVSPDDAPPPNLVTPDAAKVWGSRA